MKKLILVAAMAGGLGLIGGHAMADRQPVMRKALENLEQALNNLKNAQRDKGGHRARAVNLVEQAIGEVKQGIQADNEN